jgi:CheY-like chemotaxis protein
MPSNLVLIVTPDAERGDRYASSMAGAGLFGFLFATDAETAVTLATGMLPDLAIISLPAADGISLCERLRAEPEAQGLRVVLVVDRNQLGAARDAHANAVVPQPASAVLVAIEANLVLSRPERRTIGRIDRRATFRGGRRVTDIAAD